MQGNAKAVSYTEQMWPVLPQLRLKRWTSMATTALMTMTMTLTVLPAQRQRLMHRARPPMLRGQVRLQMAAPHQHQMEWKKESCRGQLMPYLRWHCTCWLPAIRMLLQLLQLLRLPRLRWRKLSSSHQAAGATQATAKSEVKVARIEALTAPTLLLAVQL